MMIQFGFAIGLDHHVDDEEDITESLVFRQLFLKPL